MEKIWLQQYPPGVPAEILLDERETLVSMLYESCRRYASRPAFHNWGATLTYADLDHRTRDFAAWLAATGMKKGERIALMMPNLLQYPVALFGALRAGLTVVNTNPLYTPRELEHQLKDSGASAIVVLANFAHVVEKVIARTQVRKVIVTQLGDMLPFPKGAAISWAARRLKKLVPEYHLEGATRFSEALEAGSRLRFEPPAITPGDVAFLQYTGGTTGVAKGAMLTHRNLVANLEQVSAMWTGIIHEGEEIVMAPLPLYHIFSLTGALTFFKFGGLNVLITNPRDMPAFIAELRHRKFTIIIGVNTLYNALLDHPGFRQLDFSRLKFGVAGGMALHQSVAERWTSTTGRPIIEGYGLTEASPVVACNLPTVSRIGAVGLPLPSTQISIRDDQREVQVGEEGELLVRGPQVMPGYWNMPDETAKTLDPDGWLHTGDIAVLDEQGFVHIVDRKKDMIIVSGFKVFPNEVEAVLTTHAAVAEAGCIGVPDAHSGQAVKAFVVLREANAVTVEQIREYCRERLTGYKTPRFVEIRDALPKTNVGKILRRALVEEQAAAQQHGDRAGAH